MWSVVDDVYLFQIFSLSLMQQREWRVYCESIVFFCNDIFFQIWNIFKYQLSSCLPKPMFSQLSPCAPLSFTQPRCSSILISDKCPYSRLSCGSIYPICCDNVSEDNNNEIKIIITDPQDTNVFSSVYDPCRALQKKKLCLHLMVVSAFQLRYIYFLFNVWLSRPSMF